MDDRPASSVRAPSPRSLEPTDSPPPHPAIQIAGLVQRFVARGVVLNRVKVLRADSSAHQVDYSVISCGDDESVLARSACSGRRTLIAERLMRDAQPPQHGPPRVLRHVCDAD